MAWVLFRRERVYWAQVEEFGSASTFWRKNPVRRSSINTKKIIPATTPACRTLRAVIPPLLANGFALQAKTDSAEQQASAQAADSRAER